MLEIIQDRFVDANIFEQQQFTHCYFYCCKTIKKYNINYRSFSSYKVFSLEIIIFYKITKSSRVIGKYVFEHTKSLVLSQGNQQNLFSSIWYKPAINYQNLSPNSVTVLVVVTKITIFNTPTYERGSPYRMFSMGISGCKTEHLFFYEVTKNRTVQTHIHN